MNLKVAKENIQNRKEARDKEKLSKYIDNQLEYEKWINYEQNCS